MNHINFIAKTVEQLICVDATSLKDACSRSTELLWAVLCEPLYIPSLGCCLVVQRYCTGSVVNYEEEL